MVGQLSLIVDLSKNLLCTFCTFALSGSARGAISPRFLLPIVFSSSIIPESYSGFFVLCSERQIRGFVHCSGIGCRHKSFFGSFWVLLDESPIHRHAQKSGNTLITDITAYKFLMILSKSLHLFALCRHKVENAPLPP